MSMPDSQDTFVTIGCGALVGLFVGIIVVVGTVSFWANSIVAFGCAIVISITVCAFLGWRHGDRFLRSFHKWIGWLR
jgi:uncharacterized membrane protein YgaE (UPF0421/DUF939 family)